MVYYGYFVTYLLFLSLYSRFQQKSCHTITKVLVGDKLAVILQPILKKKGKRL